MTNLAIAGRGIRQDADGRYCVNDLHRAAGGEARHRPGYWLAADQTKALVAEVEKAGFPAIRTKQKVGTFVACELVYAYAMWISAAFHLQVIRSFDALVTRGPQQDVQAVLDDPVTLRRALLQQLDVRERLEHEAAIRAPRAAAFDRLGDQRGSVCLTAAAKVLGLEPRKFIAWLSELRWIYRASDAGNWLGHARHCDAGDLEHRLFQPEYSHRQRVQVLVTPRGLARLALLLEQASLPTQAFPVPAHAT